VIEPGRLGNVAMEQLIRTPLTIVHVIACSFLILVVLLQPGKSGGLGAFSGVGATQVFGGRGAGNILTKITWVTTVVFFLSSMALAYLSTSSDESLLGKAKSGHLRSKSQSPTTPPLVPGRPIR
jgi:preprotein translocase subunit SecG